MFLYGFFAAGEVLFLFFFFSKRRPQISSAAAFIFLGMCTKTKILTFLLILLGANSLAYAQVEKQVAAIRGKVAAINKEAAKYTKITKNLDDISLEGTQATYFVSGKGLRKINAQIYGETFKNSLELYYQGEDLIFVYEKVSRYNGTVGMKNLKVASVEERRMYFSGGKMIRYLLGKRQITPGSTEYNEEEYRITEFSFMIKGYYKQ